MLDPYRSLQRVFLLRCLRHLLCHCDMNVMYARKTDCRGNLTVDMSFLSKEGSIQSH